MNEVRHGQDTTGEFTACGMAFDAYDSGDADEPIVFVKGKETVTCQDCRDVIDYFKMTFTTDYRVRK